MSYFVYILYSKKDEKLYTGCTRNIQKRVARHNKGFIPATKFRRPLVLIYTEKYISQSEAFQRERFLKTKWGNVFKQRVKNFYVNKISHAKRG
ncbi:MAG: GIY-YIG nuclease family protein [Parcubacteria group bacterium]|nr:GIY-YIG nuclease family protein [Parcubacteria group bacterium]